MRGQETRWCSFRPLKIKLAPQSRNSRANNIPGKCVFLPKGFKPVRSTSLVPSQKRTWTMLERVMRTAIHVCELKQIAFMDQKKNIQSMFTKKIEPRKNWLPFSSPVPGQPRAFTKLSYVHLTFEQRARTQTRAPLLLNHARRRCITGAPPPRSSKRLQGSVEGTVKIRKADTTCFEGLR